MENKRGYTLVELLIVIVIIGILATLGTVNYTRTKENTLDKDAQAALVVIRAAERAHLVDMGTCYPPAGSDSNINTINNNLKVLLSNAADRAWNYSVWSTGCSRATRNVAGGRSWYLTINDADDMPDAGAGCP